MLENFKEWLSKERLGRTEAETSQDMFPTNGDIVLWWAIFLPILVAIFVSIAFVGISNG